MTCARKPDSERKPYDEYVTPQYLADALFELIDFPDDFTFMEPCRNSATGPFYSNMPLGSAWGEIQEGVDYLETDYPHVNCIVTNPPFSHAQQFIEKGLKDADVVIMLLRLNFLESKKRYEWWQTHQPTTVITIALRPSFQENGRTDGQAYAFFVWDKQDLLKLPPFMWIGPE